MKWIRSFGYAINGLKHCLVSQRNFRVHLLATIACIAAAGFLRLPAWQWVLLLVCIGLVLAAEMLNTALEKICDYVQPLQHPQIKLVKDIAAGAVLVLAVVSLAIGLIIFLPAFFERFNY